MEQLTKPSDLSHAVGNDTILSLCTGTRDDGLSLGRPGDQVVPQKYHIAGRRAASIWTTGPVSVHVGDKVRVARTTQEETVGRRPLEVAQDALHGRQMGLPWIMHMQTDLLDGIGDVRPCEGQVLESPYNAPKLVSILNRRPRVGRNLRLEVDQSRARLTISHGSTLDDV
jgi:hypothetical protein